MHEEWFADEDRVRKAVGLLEKPVVNFSNSKEVTIYCTGIYSQEFVCHLSTFSIALSLLFPLSALFQFF